MADCIFCKIVRGELKADIVYESESVLAFKDIAPKAPTHVLVVPKEHYESLDYLPVGNSLASELVEAVQKTAARLGVSGGYKLVANCGDAAGQIVKHLHFHILAGKKFVP